MRFDDRANVTHAAATPAVLKVSGACQRPSEIADNAKALCYVFAQIAGSRYAHKATARTPVRLRANLSTARVQ
jgi:hypothetical protein